MRDRSVCGVSGETGKRERRCERIDRMLQAASCDDDKGGDDLTE